MEENMQINLKENQKMTNHLSKNKELRKRIKMKSKNLIDKANLLISNKSTKPENNNNNKNDNKQMKKERNPGVDFVRLLTQFNIVVFHFLDFSNPYKYFKRHERILRLIYSFIIWHNNAFILISGIVGYKTNKYSNLLYLWLIVVFYSEGMYKYILQYEKGFRINQNINTLDSPMVFNLYWYFTTYFGMYLFLPVLNKGIAQLSKYEFRLVVMSTLGILVLWKDYKNKKSDVFHLNGGNSVIWFLIYYLTGAYIGKFRVDYNGFKKFLYCFICGVIFILASFLYFKILIGEYFFLIGNKKIEIPIIFVQMFSQSLNSLLKITQSITICLFFMQIHYNKYIAKIICFLGPLAFSIYLIYTNQIILSNFMTKLCFNQPRNISLNSLLSLLFLKSLKVCLISLIIDYLRHLLFTLLRIKKILLVIETTMKEKFT